MSGAIKEQGPKTYAVMRARVDAAAASEGLICTVCGGQGREGWPCGACGNTGRARPKGAGMPPASEGPTTHHRAAAEGKCEGWSWSDPACSAPDSFADVVARLTGKAADATLPAGTAPEPSVQVLAAFADSTSGELRVEHDRRDGRHYVTADHDNGEIIVPVEVPPGVARGVAHVLRAGIAAGGGSVGANEPVKQPVTAVKPSDWIDPPFMTAARAPTADVENDGDRGPLPLADLARASATAKLVAACGPLDVRTVRLLVWIAEQLPADKLRASCEEATATGWCRSDATDPTARRTRVDAARSALLAAVREIEGLLVGDKERTPRRVREEVLADEIERRATGGVR